MLLAVLIVFAFVGAWSIVVITIDIVFKVQKNYHINELLVGMIENNGRRQLLSVRKSG